MAMALCRRGSLIIKSLPFSSRSLITSSSFYLSRSSDSSYRVRPVAALTEFTNRFPSTLKFMSTGGGDKSMYDYDYEYDDDNYGISESEVDWDSGYDLDDGCDYQHWLVVMEKPQGEPTRDEIIDSYIKTLSKVIGSEEEARMKIYSVSTRYYFAFGALVSEKLSEKIKDLPGVTWVLPDAYLDIKNKTYGAEPFINGKAVPYDPKYHEQWNRNSSAKKR
ncbi:hypothetical protein MKW92_051734 [Papaver armeniacum]|nr:hypothetical protein MKW92_051734 [Papaver armeniacum]